MPEVAGPRERRPSRSGCSASRGPAVPAARDRHRHPGAHDTLGDTLQNARPADLLVLLDSLQKREAALNSEVADLRRTLAAMQSTGTSDQAAIANAQARLAALSILIGAVAATGPGVKSPSTIRGPEWRRKPCSTSSTNCGPPVRETMQIGAGDQAVRVGVDTWVIGPGDLIVDSVTLRPPYSLVAIGDPPTLAAAMTIPGGALDSVGRVGASMKVDQSGPGRRDRLAATETPPIRSARQVTPVRHRKQRGAP